MSEAAAVIALEKFGSLYAADLVAIKERFGSYAAAVDGRADESRLNQKLQAAKAGLNRARSLAENLGRDGVRLIWPEDEMYPDNLRPLADRPAVLYVKGALPNCPRYLSIVGNRLMTDYAKRATDRLVSGLAGQGFVIVSGLALGVDSAAHRAALTHGVPTVAVLPIGLDAVYPRSHKRLAMDIVSNGGALVSEYPPETEVRKHQFLVRNRIVAGFATATVVIEGAVTSGSLVTARWALDYGRDVGAVPGDIFAPGSTGPHALLASGAAVITESADILRLYGVMVPDRPLAYRSKITAYVTEPMRLEALALATGWPEGQILAELTQAEIYGEIGRTETGEFYAKS